MASLGRADLLGLWVESSPPHWELRGPSLCFGSGEKPFCVLHGAHTSTVLSGEDGQKHARMEACWDLRPPPGGQFIAASKLGPRLQVLHVSSCLLTHFSMEQLVPGYHQEVAVALEERNDLQSSRCGMSRQGASSKAAMLLMVARRLGVLSGFHCNPVEQIAAGCCAATLGWAAPDPLFLLCSSSGSDGNMAIAGAEAKAILPKKEKLRLRRERWLQKIEAIKLAEQKRKEEQKRRATVVVGDLHPLRDALPELEELEARRPPLPKGVSGQPQPGELSRMSAAQRQQLLEEERTRFLELLASPAYRANPLLAIGQQLALQMQREGTSQL
ncbi:hypothetical protein H920_10456 [Fukomys damarensis]|uniref:Protein FAM207A n=1 Tax=Fukomys damarensis TaxID=885580 RepID=A0A091DAH3_FUKDA|nr:hypothetical protein H920_10456 [Fukomys damarensis]